MARAHKVSPRASGAHTLLPPLPPAAWALVVGVAAALLALLVTYPIYDPDVWQHLLVGKAIWRLHAVPHTQLWVWPTHGAPDVLPSWLFRVLVYPFWRAGHVTGLFVWRWLTTLAAFALLWAAARAAGARGPWALTALVWCAVLYRYRSQVRPETLVAVLIGAQLWLLERRRARGVSAGTRDPAWWLVPIALVWANVHISYYIGFVLTGAYLADAVVLRRRASAPQRPLALLAAMLACAAVSFVNPFGWRALWQPFEYLLTWRHEPIYQSIGELRPIDWQAFAPTLLPAWFALVGLLALLRWRRRGLDLAQLVILVVFVPQALGTQRFLGYLAVIVAPYFARDVEDALASLRLAFMVRPWPRALAASLAAIALCVPTLRDPSMPPRIDIAWREYPVGACDWIAANDVRGRLFNPFGIGGYVLWRFWPDPGRLPFMDIHQAGTRDDRYRAAYAMSDPRAWRDLDHERAFDYVVVPRRQFVGETLIDQLDSDSTWALTFLDDAAAVYLRRTGSMATLAERARYRLLPAGDARWATLGPRVEADSTLRHALDAEVSRDIASSRENSAAWALHANVALTEHRWADAERDLRAAVAASPRDAGLRQRWEMAAGRARTSH